ncbi:hypothetical protein [Roseivivax isoporae]|uniref:Uncharacterized protein n=1 Tax=Roseivivax isoporae LMG 25204 TaxID=1449351 RepID=X7FF94_9RHOB|nr:hypothetical protein [Roseivivax isoporae]ETX30746.1 hypothetical protein RISW2_08035 [Roseivivax isoporae LMG 25204]
MQTIRSGARGLWLIWNLNWDRLLYAVTILVSLWIGAFIGTL